MGDRTILTRVRTSHFLVLLLVPLLLGGLAACATSLPLPWRHQPPHPLAAQRPALRHAFVSELDHPALQDAPRYTLRETVDVTARLITGTADITLTNRTGTPWSNIALRLYPNLLHYGGGNSARLLSVSWQETPLPFAQSDSGTAVLVDLPTLVLPGEQATLRVVYRISYPRHDRNGYWLFGEYEGIINLPLAYPVLAVPTAEGGWNLSDGIPLGDTLTAEASFYHAWVTVPSTLTLVSSAVISSTKVHTDTQRVTYELVSGPAREFTLVLGEFRQREVEVDGVRVRVFSLHDAEGAAEAALRYAAATLQVYERHFGPYPFAKLDVAEAMLLNRGMEYPTLNLLGADLFRSEQGKLEFLVAHEIGHQWWYNLVGNDQVAEPWLDEGLTEYSTYFYYEDVYGPEAAESLRKARWEVPLAYVEGRGLDAPLDLPASAYSRENYETIVYAKGALFFHTLRRKLGDELFTRALHQYLDTYRYRIATAHDLQQVFEDVSGQDLGALFAAWVYEER